MPARGSARSSEGAAAPATRTSAFTAGRRGAHRCFVALRRAPAATLDRRFATQCNRQPVVWQTTPDDGGVVFRWRVTTAESGPDESSTVRREAECFYWPSRSAPPRDRCWRSGAAGFPGGSAT